VLGRPRRLPRLFLLALPALLLVASVPVTLGSAPSSGISLALASDGSVTAGLEIAVANGSALRYAMDGYFGPLVDLLPESNASKAALLAEINATEDNPVFAGLFGDRDGQVNALDVSRFQSLINSESRLIPVSTITGVLNVTMDGKGPSTLSLQDVTFTSAIGPDDSTAPIGVVAAVLLDFSWSGIGNAHTFQVAWNLPAILGNLSLPTANVNVSFTTPAAITITSVSGLNDLRTSNDPFGWGSGSTSGQYTPAPGHTIVIKFGPSFPTGDALIIGVVVIAAGVTVGLLVRRRRRGRRKTPVPASGPSSHEPSGVGPSSGSG
jgi:hypothetical protein